LISICTVLEGTLESLAERAQAKKIELAGFIEPSVPTRLSGDGSRLRQVLTDPVANPLKFTETGEVTVRVSSKPFVKIGVESAPGKGSTFWFTVRLQKSTVIESIPHANQHLVDVRVRVVDDKRTICQFLHEQVIEVFGVALDRGVSAGLRNDFTS
jgi:hypothetical protein